jgi:hypothetical protein
MIEKKMYLCKFNNKYKKMKKIIVIALIALGIVMSLASCKSQQKCPAYGHHTYYETVAPEQQL